MEDMKSNDKEKSDLENKAMADAKNKRMRLIVYTTLQLRELDQMLKVQSNIINSLMITLKTLTPNETERFTQLATHIQERLDIVKLGNRSFNTGVELLKKLNSD